MPDALSAILSGLALLANLDSANAANLTLFCKCTCEKNITTLTVPLCSACTKAFCVEQGACWLPPPDANGTVKLPADMEGWGVTCFQRGSYKDEVVVWSFILLCCGLLAWAGARQGLEAIKTRRQQQGWQRIGS
ncbi:hypothetical protein DFJ74DRAFT_701445 [Hyaloraphidium curvatum]|nr:hypothetical protein DFJ74DRAFT_701445 [Hyaloraphidium curvatum]